MILTHKSQAVDDVTDMLFAIKDDVKRNGYINICRKNNETTY